MNVELYDKLLAATQTAAENFSITERAKNTLKENFKVFDVIPLSETTAAVKYWKDGSKKLVLAFFYWRGDKVWHYFMLGESHLLGMQGLLSVYRDVYTYNTAMMREQVKGIIPPTPIEPVFSQEELDSVFTPVPLEDSTLDMIIGVTPTMTKETPE
jgi:hypothetical protein